MVYIHLIRGICRSYQDFAQTSLCMFSVAMETPTNKVKMTFFILFDVCLLFLLLSNRPVGAQVGHAGPIVNRIGLSFNMEEEKIVCDP